MTLLNKSMMRELADGYVSEVDTVDEKEWCQSWSNLMTPISIRLGPMTK